MTFYRNTYHNATRAAFAREATIDAFGPRAIRALDEPDFRDRKPVDELHGAAEPVDGIQAATHWLSLAASLDGAEAETAYQTADELRRVLGLDWADVIGQEAA